MTERAFHEYLGLAWEECGGFCERAFPFLAGAARPATRRVNLQVHLPQTCKPRWLIEAGSVDLKVHPTDL